MNTYFGYQANEIMIGNAKSGISYQLGECIPYQGADRMLLHTNLKFKFKN